jgi:outer membrane protein assembly factor BamB
MDLVKRIFPPDTDDPDKTAVPASEFSFKDKIIPVGFLWDTYRIVAIADGVKLALYSMEGTLLWSYKTGKETSIDISADGQFIAAVSQDGVVYYFRNDGTLIWNAPFKAGNLFSPHQVRISPDGEFVAASARENTGLLNARDILFFFDKQGNLLWTWSDNTTKSASISGFAIAPEGQFVLAVVDDQSLKIFSPEGKQISHYDIGKKEEKIRSIAIARESRLIIIATKLSTIHCITADGTLKWKNEVDFHGIEYISPSSTGQRFIVKQTATNAVNVFDISGQMIRKLSVFRWGEFIDSIVLSPDGMFVAATCDQKLHCMEIDSKFHWVFRAGKNNIHPLSVSPDSQHLIAYTLDEKFLTVQPFISQLYLFHIRYFRDTPDVLRKKAVDALGRLHSECHSLEKDGIVHGAPLQHIEELITGQRYIEAISEIKHWSREIQSVKKAGCRASSIIKEVPAPSFHSLFAQGRYREIIEYFERFIEQKKQIPDLIETAETIGTLPESIKDAAVSSDPETVTTAYRDLERFIAEAHPDIQIVLGPMHYYPDIWSKTPVEISNSGDAHAFGVTLAFSDEVETRGLHPADVPGLATITADIGIRPKTKGTTPIDVSIHYTDHNKKEYQQEFQFWIEIADQGSSSPQVAKTSPEVLVYSPYGAGQFPPELSHRYTEPELIGSGGFARVFKARRKDGQIVAVKVPISFDARTGKTFLAELQNWTRLSHPNIVKVYTFNVMPVPYFEMELCDSSLSAVKKPVESEEAAWIVFNICEGLRFAHVKKIIHRDLKPQNILLKNGVPKISDWGLSRVVTESVSTTAASFTPQYAAPEQIGNKAKDELTDIWQIGVILYELVTGSLPFTGASLIEIGMNIVTKNPQPPGDINPRIKTLDPVIMRCLEKDPGKRYPSVRELQIALGLSLKIHYTASLEKSMSAKDFTRSASYCGDLVVISLLTGDMPAAIRYTNDLIPYAQGDVASMARELSEQIHFRMDQGITEVPDELIIKAELITHKIRLGLTLI